MYKLFFLFLLTFWCYDLDAQNQSPEIFKTDWSVIAVGIGQDYGGWGINYTAYPQKNIGFFVSGGALWGSLGYNVGLKTRLLSNKKKMLISPFLKGMYGYNAAFIIPDKHTLNKNFYGLTFGGRG